MNRIEGFLRTLSPIHQTKPGVNGFVDIRDGDSRMRLAYSDMRKGRCNVQMSALVYTESGERTEVPIISGNSTRGVLRRHASRILFRRINQLVRPELFMCVTAGSYHKNDMGGAKTAEMLNKADRHVFVGLFGGGGSGLESGYSCGDMYPVAAQAEHLIPAWVRDQAGMIQRRQVEAEGSAVSINQGLTEIYATIRKDPFLDGEGVAFIHDHDRRYAESLAKGAAGEDRNDIRMMSYVQAIIPGVPLSFNLAFKPRVGEHQVGLALLALLDMVNGQALAGASRRGFGRFHPNLKLFHELLDEPVNIFEPVQRAGSIEGYTLNPALAIFTDAAEDALGKVSIAELEDLLVTTLPKTAEDVPTTGAKRKKKAEAPDQAAA